jgi:hypothetical protein
MTPMKKQESIDGIRGLFFLEPCYILWPVGIDKSWPIHTSSNITMLSNIYNAATKYKDVPTNRPFGTYNLNFAVTERSQTTSPVQQNYFKT